jgi:mannose-6-phosphate isomerase-like protein (cupin superfamily)
MEPLRKISIAEKLASFDDQWSPKTLASVGDYAVKAVKIAGEFVWHDHPDDDELFYVVRGGIAMEYRLNGAERVERFGPGEMLRVPKGMEHRPVAEPGTEILLFERESLVNTGTSGETSRTKEAVRI